MRYRYLAVAISGASATVIQTVIIRESLVLFSGYELVSGLLLFGWLVWNAIGSLVFARIRSQNADAAYAWLLIITSMLALLTVTGLRFAPVLFGIQFGYIISIDKMFMITIIMLAPLCFFNGALFPAACRVLDVPRVYWLEGIGAFAGGLILSFIMIQFLPSYGILILMAIVISISAILLIRNFRLIFIPILLAVVFIFTKDIEFKTRQQQMGGQDLVETKESRHGSIVVTRTNGQYNFYTHGFFDFAFPDRYTSEEAVHYAMLVHDQPRTVLLIGAGVASAVENIIMHPDVVKLTYIELDPELVNLSLKYITSGWIDDNRVEIKYGDARQIMQTADDLYDVIILNLPEPSNNMLNRYYTVEFFNLTKKRLNPGGRFALRISASVDIIDARHGQLLNSIYGSLRQSFPEVLALPASKVVFIGMAEQAVKGPIADLLLKNIDARALALSYVNAGYIIYNLSEERILYLDQRINYFKGRLNYDLEPVCYYYATLLWSGTSRTMRNIFYGFKTWFIWILILPVILVLIIAYRKILIYVSLFSVGASTIIAEITILILFQIAYGYMYAWIGMLIACYMLGLSIGAFAFIKCLKHPSAIALSYIQFGIAVLFLVQIIFCLMRLPLATIFLPLLTFLFGFCGGMHFPVAVHILTPKRSGIAYAIDLTGAGLGALLVSVFLIPLFGLLKIILYFVVLNLLLGIMFYALRGRFQS